MIPLPSLDRLAWPACVLLLALLFIQTYRLANERADHARAVGQHAAQMRELSDAAAKAMNEYREKERIANEARDTAIRQANQETAKANADRAAAVDARERLRNEFARQLAARRGCPASGAAPAAGGAPAAPPVDLLADVQRRLDEASDGIAEFADRAATAGAACERIHDSTSSKEVK